MGRAAPAVTAPRSPRGRLRPARVAVLWWQGLLGVEVEVDEDGDAPLTRVGPCAAGPRRPLDYVASLVTSAMVRRP